MESVKAQQAVHERLSAASAAALARVQSASIGLDGLVARMAEIVALADGGPASGMAAAQLGQLAPHLAARPPGTAKGRGEKKGLPAAGATGTRKRPSSWPSRTVSRPTGKDSMRVVMPRGRVSINAAADVSEVMSTKSTRLDGAV